MLIAVTGPCGLKNGLRSKVNMQFEFFLPRFNLCRGILNHQDGKLTL